MLLGATSGAGSVAVAMEDVVPQAALLVELAEASCRGVLRSDAGAGARRAAAARAVGEALGEEALLDAAAVREARRGWEGEPLDRARRAHAHVIDERAAWW